jgi:putative glutamine amidotransferase
MLIAVTKLAPNYENWLRKLDSKVDIADLYTMDLREALKIAEESSGILLTGGSDINPTLFGHTELSPLCRDIDEKRDHLELLVVELAFRRKIPTFGICRGQQMLNVAMKGTLIADIPSALESTVEHAGSKDVYHDIIIMENSRIAEITGILRGVVNSSHHQAVKLLSPVFQAVAFGTDSVIEAIEADPAVHPFCIAVQWHPERMDPDDPLSGKLGKAFLDEASHF